MTKSFQICIFEDDICKHLTPYQLTRPTYTVPIGMGDLVSKITQYSKETPVTLLTYSNHELLLKKRFPKTSINLLNKSLPTLYLNGRINLSFNDYKSIIEDINFNKNNLFINNQSIIAIFSHDSNNSLFQLLSQYPSFDQIIKLIRQTAVVRDKKNIPIIKDWWDYLDQFSTTLEIDFDVYENKCLIEGDISGFSIFSNDSNMSVHRSAKICESVSIDATKGPVIIMDNVNIKPFSRIEGPCYIGSHSVIQTHSDIGGSYIGSHCKIGGEVKQSIIQSYTNKSHFGFIGDSMIGEWVNLGAGTTSSNLKLSYGEIKSISSQSTELVSTNRQFLGSILGDYVKTSIHTQLDCGSAIGNGSSLFGNAVHAKVIPPFTWGEKNNYSQQNIQSFLISLERMMARRNKHISEEESIQLNKTFKSIKESIHAPSNSKS